MSRLCWCIFPRPSPPKVNRVDIRPKDKDDGKKAWLQKQNGLESNQAGDTPATFRSHPTVILLGLDYSGKTTLANQLCLHRFFFSSPTTSPSLLPLLVSADSRQASVLDLPGHASFRSRWASFLSPPSPHARSSEKLTSSLVEPTYPSFTRVQSSSSMAQPHSPLLSIIYVINLVDRLRLSLAISELLKIASLPDGARTPLLVVLNDYHRTDLGNILMTRQNSDDGLDPVQSHPVGIDDNARWIEAVQSRIKHMLRHPSWQLVVCNLASADDVKKVGVHLGGMSSSTFVKAVSSDQHPVAATDDNDATLKEACYDDDRPRKPSGAHYW